MSSILFGGCRRDKNDANVAKNIDWRKDELNNCCLKVPYLLRSDRYLTFFHPRVQKGTIMHFIIQENAI